MVHNFWFSPSSVIDNDDDHFNVESFFWSWKREKSSHARHMMWKRETEHDRRLCVYIKSVAKSFHTSIWNKCFLLLNVIDMSRWCGFCLSDYFMKRKINNLISSLCVLRETSPFKWRGSIFVNGHIPGTYSGIWLI